MLNNIIIAAYIFTEKKCKGAFRKLHSECNPLPAFLHSKMVARYVEVTECKLYVAAALMHDLIEDGKSTVLEIKLALKEYDVQPLLSIIK